MHRLIQSFVGVNRVMSAPFFPAELNSDQYVFSDAEMFLVLAERCCEPLRWGKHQGLSLAGKAWRAFKGVLFDLEIVL